MYFRHEHPYSATSWKTPEVQEILGMEGVRTVRGDMCAFGMYQETDDEQPLVMKPSGFMTNADEIWESAEQDM